MLPVCALKGIGAYGFEALAIETQAAAGFRQIGVAGKQIKDVPASFARANH